MIAKGNLHDGNRLAAYLVTGKTGERAELALMEGFAASDLRDAFRDVEIQARATKARFPFFHLYTRFPRGEIVDDEKGRALCLEIVRREIAALGFAGQPYAVAFQIDRATGELHVHAGISRIARRDGGRLFAIDPGLYKNRLKEISRECERDYGLTIVSSDRQPGDRARAAGRDEFEESRRLDTDLKTIRTTILDCFETSDSGRAFNAALDAAGLMLAAAATSVIALSSSITPAGIMRSTRNSPVSPSHKSGSGYATSTGRSCRASARPRSSGSARARSEAWRQIHLEIFPAR